MTRASEPSVHHAAPREHLPAAELAAFVADISGELSRMTGKAGWPLLTYLLNTVRIEAEARVAEEKERPQPIAPKVRRRRR